MYSTKKCTSYSFSAIGSTGNFGLGEIRGPDLESEEFSDCLAQSKGIDGYGYLTMNVWRWLWGIARQLPRRFQVHRLASWLRRLAGCPGRLRVHNSFCKLASSRDRRAGLGMVAESTRRCLAVPRSGTSDFPNPQPTCARARRRRVGTDGSQIADSGEAFGY